MKLHIDRNADRLDTSEDTEIGDEYLKDELNKVCSPCEYEDFKEWITESNWSFFHTGVWINTKTRATITTETLYKKYLDARESENSQS